MPSKKSVVVFGCGKVGRLVSCLLAQSGDYFVTLADSHAKTLAHIKKQQGTKNREYVECNFAVEKDIKSVIKNKHYAISCAPFYCNTKIAASAHALGVHYLDLTEDVKTTNFIKNLAHKSTSAFIPQCGIAPGFITIVTNYLVHKFDKVEEVKMRVGALPLFPHNRMKYNLTWSTEGLINEYCNDCDVIIDGKLTKVPALEGEERFHIDGAEYEAFNTSGGLGTLAESLAGKVKRMDYKSIRYPGHRDIMLTLLHDLKFIEHRDELKKVFERSLPHTYQDHVIIFVTVSGYKNGVFAQESYCKKIHHSILHKEEWSAIQITTAAGICAVLDIHAQGKGGLSKKGFIRQEDINFETFIENRFGKYYA